MNILIFSWRGPGHPQAGGAELMTHEHAKSWVKAGHQVFLFTAKFKKCSPENVIDGVRIIRQGGDVFGVQIAAFFWYLFANRPRFDLVIDQFHGIPFFTPIYVKVKKLSFIHEVAKEVWKLNPWPKPLNLIPAIIGPLFEPLIFKMLYRRVPFMTVSKSTQEDLVAWGIPKDHIFIVHNGVSIIEPKKKRTKESKKTLVYLGSLTRDKGIEDALVVFKQLDQRNKNYQYWVIGKGEKAYFQFLKKKTKFLGIEKKVKFWGFVKDQKKFELLQRAHLLINPSIREGWGLVVIEAARMGVPTIAYNVPGLKDSIQNDVTGNLVEPSVKDLTAKVEELLGDETKYKYLAKNCLKWSRHFSWDRSTKKSLALINSL